MKAFIGNCESFDDHVLIEQIEDTSIGMKGIIAIHRRREGLPSIGSTRYVVYEDEQQMLEEALYLSKAMTSKLAVSGYAMGGAKGIISCKATSLCDRFRALETYFKAVNRLSGKFVTGGDVGFPAFELTTYMNMSRYVCGIDVQTEKHAAHSVYNAMRIFEETFPERLAHRPLRVAIQGLGKTGLMLACTLRQRRFQIFASDLNPTAERRAEIACPGITIVPLQQLFSQEVDFFSPCAVGRCLTEEQARLLRCSAVIGTTNNPFYSSGVEAVLQKQGIYYVPDYLANCGALISVIEELFNKSPSNSSINLRIGAAGELLRSCLRLAIRNKTRVSKECSIILENLLAPSNSLEYAMS